MNAALEVYDMQSSSAVVGRRVCALRVHTRRIRVPRRLRAQDLRSNASAPAERAIQGISTWKGLVRALWTAAEGETFAEQRSVYAACLVDAVKRLNVSSDERLSVRLGLSLTWLAHRLGVTREMFYALPIDFERLSFRELVVIASLLAQASVTDVRLLEAISQGVDEGRLDWLRADEMVTFLHSMAGINWQGSQPQKNVRGCRGTAKPCASGRQGVRWALAHPGSGPERARGGFACGVDGCRRFTATVYDEGAGYRG